MPIAAPAIIAGIRYHADIIFAPPRKWGAGFVPTPLVCFLFTYHTNLPPFGDDLPAKNTPVFRENHPRQLAISNCVKDSFYAIKNPQLNIGEEKVCINQNVLV